MELVSDSNAVLEPFIKMPLPSIEFARSAIIAAKVNEFKEIMTDKPTDDTLVA